MILRSLIIYLLSAFLTSVFACRLWAVCTKSGFALSTLPSGQKNHILDDLDGYFEQSKSMPNGWALLNYDSIPDQATTSIYRSSFTAYSDSLAYWKQVNTMIDSGQNRIGLGHLRIATSGADNIPNPHPWMFYHNGHSFSLIHNGTINKSKLYNIITNNGSDLSWLDQHNPNTFSEHLWSSSEGWSTVVDSNLLLLLIMQHYMESENLYEAIQLSLSKLMDSGINANQLNVIISDGFELFVFGGSNGLSIVESSTYFSVMTEPNTYSQNSDLSWTGILENELIIINKSGISRVPNFIDQSINDESISPSLFVLKPAFPNPFNGEVTIPFQIEPITKSAQLSIFSILGENIYNTIVTQDQLRQGFIRWNPLNNSQSSVSSGTYIIRLENDLMSSTKKILFIK